MCRKVKELIKDNKKFIALTGVAAIAAAGVVGLVLYYKKTNEYFEDAINDAMMRANSPAFEEEAVDEN